MILLQASSGGGMGSLLFMGLILVVFYVFMIMPQMRKQKKQRQFREEIDKGHKVVTIGGIHGKVTAVNDDNTMTIESEGTKLRIDRNAISMESTTAVNKPAADKK